MTLRAALSPALGELKTIVPIGVSLAARILSCS
jgi:hypothetical protein